ncbi:hypothetical protein E1301_Tti002363 [Triplophysa tibetana]|uniref:Uncharacterized protein n=1 Tax=Triplophysa tibetana TaxID=1572043 RepID=A0A5A9NCD1_9TELE|nr:hypothetical protein E1301_Tti002363 [Triplophysa tibetana]
MGLDARKRVTVKMMLPVTELPASVIVFLVTMVISVNTCALLAFTDIAASIFAIAMETHHVTQALAAACVLQVTRDSAVREVQNSLM